ncbi:MAG: hypothetical protein D6782_06605 [Alphaproteobacteria bacterium]|nr:MAG: hypothetical protein D6782_06605 [Alphaproteobacteria bacterium]
MPAAAPIPAPPRRAAIPAPPRIPAQRNNALSATQRRERTFGVPAPGCFPFPPFLLPSPARVRGAKIHRLPSIFAA